MSITIHHHHILNFNTYVNYGVPIQSGGDLVQGLNNPKRAKQQLVWTVKCDSEKNSVLSFFDWPKTICLFITQTPVVGFERIQQGFSWYLRRDCLLKFYRSKVNFSLSSSWVIYVHPDQTRRIHHQQQLHQRIIPKHKESQIHHLNKMYLLERNSC